MSPSLHVLLIVEWVSRRLDWSWRQPRSRNCSACQFCLCRCLGYVIGVNSKGKIHGLRII